MITYKQAETLEELEQILALQQRNLPKNISAEESLNEGFLTVEHDMDILKAMNDVCGHIIAVDDDQVVGYALCMHPKFALSIKVLQPMFVEINKVITGKKNYMAMGQICVAKSHRGKGIFRNLYLTMKEKLPDGFDTIITEVDGKNKRSLAAHAAIGFTTLKVYMSGDKEWHLVALQ
ncbi:GNAT family N-acetyltransferase [Flagellimonas zhangzhouensis]|uniref:Acetyltransferase (GNAT) domain-containing protein n=1 Tax=Flagellimonas zhangzhouensis TaxID=1073328 RepID=A0A1H2VAG2_9FLAO|nr:GNAT family N-acetyltransferase [Allomuricauda zhangzhouensis]SDQ09441.1 Acetyltransferase (GNAT) family protein [Allomuricauda zhangzhouensis]SDW65275.1 Acetyltransferase (GNAT) domain-containing protein [Allomuricauda zhangzhouensis]